MLKAVSSLTTTKKPNKKTEVNTKKKRIKNKKKSFNIDRDTDSPWSLQAKK